MSAPVDLPYRLTHITVKLSPSLLSACFCNRNTFIGWIVDVCTLQRFIYIPSGL
jgi:hypothetical protein